MKHAFDSQGVCTACGKTRGDVAIGQLECVPTAGESWASSPHPSPRADLEAARDLYREHSQPLSIGEEHFGPSPLRAMYRPWWATTKAGKPVTVDEIMKAAEEMRKLVPQPAESDPLLVRATEAGPEDLARLIALGYGIVLAKPGTRVCAVTDDLRKMSPVFTLPRP